MLSQLCSSNVYSFLNRGLCRLVLELLSISYFFLFLCIFPFIIQWRIILALTKLSSIKIVSIKSCSGYQCVSAVFSPSCYIGYIYQLDQILRFSSSFSTIPLIVYLSLFHITVIDIYICICMHQTVTCYFLPWYLFSLANQSDETQIIWTLQSLFTKISEYILFFLAHLEPHHSFSADPQLPYVQVT